MDEFAHLLAHFPVFAALPEEEIQYLAATLRLVDLPPATLLFHEGDPGEFFYIVLDGQLEVVKALGTVDEQIIARRGTGEFVGEMSLLNLDGLRTASIRACVATRLLELPRGQFYALLERQPEFVYEVVKALSTRLSIAHDMSIHDLQQKNRQLTEAYEALQAAQAQIIEKETLERELRVAYEIQMSILPQTLPQVEGYDFAARVIPARSVGGDLFDMIVLDPDHVGLVVGDVSDKGVPAAIFMAQVHALLHAEAGRGCPPSDVLRAVNNTLLDMNARGLFVSVLYGVLDRLSGEFVYARAGHELPLVCTAEGEIIHAPFGDGTFLGLFAAPEFEERALRLPPGGTLLLYTDGVTDGRDPLGTSFGIERLELTLRACADLPAPATADTLLRTLSGWRGTAPQDDDITVVVAHARR